MIILTMFMVLLLLLSINVPIAIGLAVTTIIAMVMKTGTSFLIDTAVSIKKLVPVFITIAIIVVTASPIAIGTFIDRRSNKTINIVRIIIKYPLFALRLYFEVLNFYNLLEFLRFQTE